MDGRKFVIVTFVLALSVGMAFGQKTATIKGKVVFKGKPLPDPKIVMRQDKNCLRIHKGKPVPKGTFVLNKNGTLKWVLIYVKSGVKGKYRPPKKPVVLDQKGCIYRPHVFGIMVGQTLEIRNSDGFLHNVHFVARKNRGFNMAQPTKAIVFRRKFTKPELPPSCYFKCDVHPWMRAYVGIFTHPFFDVTGDEGTFVIKGLPPGTYVVEAWHERLGRRSMKVTVKAGETKTVTFVFERKRRR